MLTDCLLLFGFGETFEMFNYFLFNCSIHKNIFAAIVQKMKDNVWLEMEVYRIRTLVRKLVTISFP